MTSEDGGTQGPHFGTTAQLLSAAKTLTGESDHWSFVQAAMRNEVGRAFLAGPDWLAIQAALAASAPRQPHMETVDAAERWDGYVDRMAGLPTTKMAHEFFCALQVDLLGRKFLASSIWRLYARARFPELDPVTGAGVLVPEPPRVGDEVLYVSYGTPGGEFARAERAATVTEVGGWLNIEITGEKRPQPPMAALRRVVQVFDPLVVRLFVMNPDGTFHTGPVRYDYGQPVLPDDAERRGVAGYVIRGWLYAGGSWHWPVQSSHVVHVPSPVSANCQEHGPGCKTWLPTLDGGSHIGGSGG